MKKISLFFVSVGLLAAATAFADFDSAKWQFKKELLVPSGAGGFGEVVFDAEVFGKAKADLSDVRIVGVNNAEVPYVLATEAPQRSRENYPAAILNKGITPGEFTAFITDIGRGGALNNRLEILTNSENFRRQVAVEGSNDKENWLTIAEKSIYDYTLEFNAKDTSVEYPEATWRYLRVKIFDRGEKPLTILSARVYRETAVAAKEIRYPGVILEQTQDAAHRASVVIIDIGAKGLPTGRIALETDDINFNREIALEGSNDGASWAILGARDVIFSYDTPKFRGAKLETRYGENSYRYLRLTIFNKDNQPITIKGAAAFGLLRKMIFAFDPASRYSLYYGNPLARFPEYDLKDYLAYFDADARRSASLGPEAANDQYVPPAPPIVPFSERYSWLLIAVLVLAVIVVGLLAFQMLKRTVGSPPASP